MNGIIVYATKIINYNDLKLYERGVLNGFFLTKYNLRSRHLNETHRLSADE